MLQNLCRETKTTLRFFPSQLEIMALIASLTTIANELPSHIEEVEIILPTGKSSRFTIDYLQDLAAIAADQGRDHPSEP